MPETAPCRTRLASARRRAQNEPGNEVSGGARHNEHRRSAPQEDIPREDVDGRGQQRVDGKLRAGVSNTSPAFDTYVFSK